MRQSYTCSVFDGSQVRPFGGTPEPRIGHTAERVSYPGGGWGRRGAATHIIAGAMMEQISATQRAPA